MKNLLFSLVALFLLGSGTIFATNDHTFSICNINRDSLKSFTFQVWIKNVSATSTDTIYIQAPTININLNTAIANGGTLTCKWGDTTNSYLKYKVLPLACRTNLPTYSAGIFRASGKGKSLNADGIHENAYRLLPGDSVLAGIYRISTSAAAGFAVASPNLAFRVPGSSPYTFINYFKRYDETSTSSGTGFGSANDMDPANGAEPAFFTLTVTGNVTFINIDATGNTALPVELTSFASVVSGREVTLNWKTATEVNFAKFVVERTVSGANSWSSVGSVAASGNSSSPKSYSFSDKKLNTGVYSYRLKLVDNDGSFTYSNSTVEGNVAKPKAFELSQNYPNPFNPTTKVDYQLAEDSRVVVEIYNIAGQKVAQLVNDQQAAGYYTVSVGSSVTSSMASGVYLYRIAVAGTSADAKFVSIKKMILMK